MKLMYDCQQASNEWTRVEASVVMLVCIGATIGVFVMGIPGTVGSITFMCVLRTPCIHVDAQGSS